MKILRIFLLLVFSVSLVGCQSADPYRKKKESKKDVEEALKSVAEAYSGKELTEKELQNLRQQIKKNPEARSAVQVITDAVSGKEYSVKYCAVTGRRYAPHLEICPEHNVQLKIVEE